MRAAAGGSGGGQHDKQGTVSRILCFAPCETGSSGSEMPADTPDSCCSILLGGADDTSVWDAADGHLCGSKQQANKTGRQSTQQKDQILRSWVWRLLPRGCTVARLCNTYDGIPVRDA
jgi:hypothetical protein